MPDTGFAPLRADIDFLATTLGDVIRQAEGEELFGLVERVRGLTKQIRAENQQHHAGQLQQQLTELFAGLSSERCDQLVRAFSTYFQLVNLAEEIHRVRVNRERGVAATRDEPRSESVQAAFKALRDDGWSATEVRNFLDGLDVQLTITAHPTEVRRYTVRLKLERISHAMRKLAERDLSRAARAALRAEVRAEIAGMWFTRELPLNKPAVEDEAKSALYYFDRSIMAALPRILADIEHAFGSYFQAESPTPLPPVLRFRSWIGGDRDGNPFVTPEVLDRVLALQSRMALEAARADMDVLVQRLSLWDERSGVPAELKRRLDSDPVAELARARFPDEPFRQLVWTVHHWLGEELEAGGSYPGGNEGYAADLELLERALAAAGNAETAQSFVRPVLYRARAFGFHLAAMDTRENSQVHERVIADLFSQAGVTHHYTQLPEDERVELLERELNSARPLSGPLSSLREDSGHALDFVRVLRRARSTHGSDSVGSYVISMTEGVSDVLEVLVLGLEAGLAALDVTPLFETREDLERAPEVLRRLFAIPAYLRHVRGRGVQEIMIGYSDSNKDAGFLTANWALFEAQEGVASACRDAGVKWRIFHGRGTSIGRGGGPTGMAILAQPPGSLSGRMRITEQGEALSARYSDEDLAHRHLEQLVHAFLLSSARDSRESPTVAAGFREVMHQASQAAHARYRELLEADGFLDFYHSVTPIEELSRLKIGSRPARRQGERSLANLRAIPWVFSWTQCRANLPGWYGLGSGLAAAPTAMLQRMYREWPFFRTVIDFAQMSIAKSDMDVFQAWLRLVPERLRGPFGKRIMDEFGLTVGQIQAVTGAGLLADDPTLARSVDLRNPYVDPISYLQVELLQRLRGGQADDSARLEHAMLVSLQGVAAALRNTG